MPIPGGDPSTALRASAADPASPDEHVALVVVWAGVVAVTVALALGIAEAAVIPLQVGESVTAADSFGNFWPLFGVLALGAIGLASLLGGRRFRRTARRRREWVRSVRR